MAPIFAIAIALVFAALAAWMLLLARGTERSEDLRQRLKTSGPADDYDLPTSRNRRAETPLIRWVELLLWRAGIQVSSSRIVLGLLLALFFAVLIVLRGGLFWGGGIAAGLLLVVYIVLLRLGARRRRKIVEQLPDFLESVIRVLAAGNSLEEAFGAAARESTDPIRPLFLSVVRQVKLGAPIDQVLAETGAAYRLRDLRVLGLASNVNKRYGGSIRAVLKSMIVAVRQRSMAARELRALTGETRFSALVLALVPIGLSAYIYSRNTEYYAAMFRDPQGRNLLIAAILLQVAGSFVLWLMLNSTETAES